MQHPCLIKNKQGYNYYGLLLNVQMFQIVDVPSNHSSMMRALVMDFATDKQALDINDEYMFGKSILVCPVTKGMYSKDQQEDFSTIKSRSLYLPKSINWYDFWTDEKQAGGQILNKETLLDIMPLYVNAGTILLLGPKVQYASEKKWDNLEVRIYEGANGEFILYEDENDNYNYEKGALSTITFNWNDTKKELIISDRKGSFSGMLTERKFNLVKVTKQKGIGVGADDKFDPIVAYNGKRLVIKLL
jgi:alpha-D-xyloside xylohydrolase